MTSKKQTLGEYLKRKQGLRNPYKYQGLSQTERERIEYFDAKKNKVGVLLIDILHQVKKSVENEENRAKIEKMIKSAIEEIKTEFDNTNKFTEQKPKSLLSQIETQPQLSRISINQKLPLNETDSRALKELNRANRIPTRQEAQKGKVIQSNDGSRAKQNSKMAQVKSRTFLAQGR